MRESYAIRQYKEVLSWFSQESTIEEKNLPIQDINKNKLDSEKSIQFPEYVGTKINILV